MNFISLGYKQGILNPASFFVMGKSKFNYEFLPSGVANIIKKMTKGERDYRTQNNYLLIVGLIFHHQMSDDASYFEFKPLSAEYWCTVVGSHYSPYMSRLVAEKVIQKEYVNYVNDFGRSSRVMGFRLNPALLNGKFSLIRYAGAKSESDTAFANDNLYNENDKIIKLGINPDLIRIEKAAAKRWISGNISSVVDGYMNPEYVEGVPDTLPVLVRIYRDDDRFISSHMSINKAKQIAKEEGASLIYYKDKFIIAKKERFIEIANHNLSMHYKWQTDSCRPENFNFSRNKNTLRVYSKLSSLPTALLPFLRINGQYIQQADLKCSQFTLFANLINFYLNHSGEELISMFKKKQVKTFVSGLVTVLDKHKDELPEEGLNTTKPQENPYITNDVYKFLVDSLQHDFYGIVRSELGLPQREHGKGIAFRTVFSKPKSGNELVRQFRQLYPTVISIINDFKDKYNYNQFAIGLQRVEASIFIDHIWKKAKQERINCFTRHDSLVFPITKKKDVDKIVTDVFTSFDFIHKVVYEEFNTEEILQRLVNETDYIDSIEDFDELFFYTMEQADKEKRQQKLYDHFHEQLQDVILPEHVEDDYHEFVNLDALWVLLELDGISLDTRLAIEEDIANLQSNYPIPQFTEATNKFLTALIELLN